MNIIERLREEEAGFLKKLAECREDIAQLTGDTEETNPVTAPRFLQETSGRLTDIFGGLIHEGSIGLLVSKGGLGKTTLMTQLAISIAAGRHTIGMRVEGPKKVLMVEAEGSRVAFRSRVEKAHSSLGISPSENWFIHPPAFTDFRIGSPYLEALIAKSGARLVILDTLGYFHAGDPNKEDEWKANVMRPLRALVGRYGCAFVLVHHPSKGGESARGTSAMEDDADFVMRLSHGSREDEPSADVVERDLHVSKNKNGLGGFCLPLSFDRPAGIFRERR